VKGAGYQVSLGGIRAFLPGSHLGKGISTKFERLKDKEIDLKIIEFSRRDRNIVVSRREYLKDLEEKKKRELFSSLTPGKVLEGKIKSVVDFGIFVDVGGYDGLVHRTEICWKDIPVPGGRSGRRTYLAFHQTPPAGPLDRDRRSLPPRQPGHRQGGFGHRLRRLRGA